MFGVYMDFVKAVLLICLSGLLGLGLALLVAFLAGLLKSWRKK